MIIIMIIITIIIFVVIIITIYIITTIVIIIIIMFSITFIIIIATILAFSIVIMMRCGEAFPFAEGVPQNEGLCLGEGPVMKAISETSSHQHQQIAFP